MRITDIIVARKALELTFNFASNFVARGRTRTANSSAFIKIKTQSAVCTCATFDLLTRFLSLLKINLR